MKSQPSPRRKLEFIAKTVTDLGKAIFVVGIASYFFERFSLVWRVLFSIISIGMIFVGFLMYPEEGGEG